jgi:hypothetical protein
MGLKKGQTNNRAGRPPKGRALAERLTTALNKSSEHDGVKRKNIVILADAVIRALVTGEIELPSGMRAMLEPKEWVDLLRFIAAHVDGPIKTEIEHSGAIRLIEVDIADDASDEN